MEYKKLNDCWLGLKKKDLNGLNSILIEEYNPFTGTWNQWQKRVNNGMNNIYANGGVSLGGTVGGGSVFEGPVRQGYGGYGYKSIAAIEGPINPEQFSPGLGWVL